MKSISIIFLTQLIILSSAVAMEQERRPTIIQVGKGKFIQVRPLTEEQKKAAEARRRELEKREKAHEHQQKPEFKGADFVHRPIAAEQNQQHNEDLAEAQRQAKERLESLAAVGLPPVAGNVAAAAPEPQPLSVMPAAPLVVLASDKADKPGGCVVQ